MKLVKVPVSNELLLQLLCLDSSKYQIHSAQSSSDNPFVTNIFIQGEDLQDIQYGDPIPEATIVVETKRDLFGNMTNEGEIQVRK